MLILRVFEVMKMFEPGNVLSIKLKSSDFEMRNISYVSKIDSCRLIWDKYKLILEIWGGLIDDKTNKKISKMIQSNEE